jgi:hypothetical protein
MIYRHGQHAVPTLFRFNLDGATAAVHGATAKVGGFRARDCERRGPGRWHGAGSFCRLALLGREVEAGCAHGRLSREGSGAVRRCFRRKRALDIRGRQLFDFLGGLSEGDPQAAAHRDAGLLAAACSKLGEAVACAARPRLGVTSLATPVDPLLRLIIGIMSEPC